MRKLKLLVNLTFILAMISVFALVFLFLALVDIGHQESDLTLEWLAAGICFLVLSAFTVLAMVMFAFLFTKKEFK